jgi:hypothetical protein
MNTIICRNQFSVAGISKSFGVAGGDSRNSFAGDSKKGGEQLLFQETGEGEVES